MIARILSILLLIGLSLTLHAQRPELSSAETVHDSVMAAVQRDLAAGLWAEARASGELKGFAVLDMVIDDRGRCESARITESDLPIKWKNIVKDQWYDRRFGFKLARNHKEKITINLQLP